jgi:hypothetical protein
MRQMFLFVLRYTLSTQMQCEHDVEFLNVKPGGKQSYRKALKG